MISRSPMSLEAKRAVRRFPMRNNAGSGCSPTVLDDGLGHGVAVGSGTDAYLLLDTGAFQSKRPALQS
jgi:hypothetical protein